MQSGASCRRASLPSRLVIRLRAHGLPPREVEGGTYAAATEFVEIAKPKKSGTIRLLF